MPKEIHYPPGTVVNGYEILDTVIGHFNTINMRAYKARCTRCKTKRLSSIYSLKNDTECKVCHRHRILKSLLENPKVIDIKYDIKSTAQNWLLTIKCNKCNSTRKVTYKTLKKEALDTDTSCLKCMHRSKINTYLDGLSYSEAAAKLGVCKETARMITQRKLNPSKEQHLGTLRTWYSKKSNA
jgi:hypothetical protein